MIPISCNAIGDIIALIDIGVTVCKRIVGMKNAKTEYKQVLADLKSLRSILQQLDCILCTLGESESEELIQLINHAKCDIGEALHHLIKHDALDTRRNHIPAHARICAGWDALRWTLNGRKDVDEGMTKLSKTLGVLHLAVGVVQLGNSNAQSQRLLDGQSQLLTVIADVRAETLHILQQNENLTQDIATAVTVTRDSSADILNEIATRSRTMHGSLNDIVQQGLARDQRVDAVERLDDMRRLEDRQWLEETLNAQLRAILQAPHHRHPSFVTEIWQFFPGRQRLAIVATAAFARNRSQLPSSQLMSGCIGSLLTLAFSSPSSMERVGYALCALSLLLVMGVAKMYKAPKVAHIIIIADFFGYDFELPLFDTTSSTSLHEALERHFEDKRGINLTRARMYELALTDDLPRAPQVALAVTWDVPLKPGQRLIMSARMYERSGRCPACKTLCSPGCPPPDGWTTCTKCSVRFDFKSPAADEYIEKVARSPLAEPEGSTTPEGPTHADIIVPLAPTPAPSPQAILEEIGYCHRIRVLVLGPTTPVYVDANEQIEAEVVDEVDGKVKATIAADDASEMEAEINFDDKSEADVDGDKVETEVDDEVKAGVEDHAGPDDDGNESFYSYSHTPGRGPPRMDKPLPPPLTPQDPQYRIPYATPSTSPYAGSSAHMSPLPATPQSTGSSPYQPLTSISPAPSQLPGSVAPSQYFGQCVWDVTQLPNQACTPDRQPFAPYLAQPGTDFPVPRVTLYLHIGLLDPRAVVVNAADRRTVTINDILAYIHATLHCAIGQALWNNLSPPKQQRIVRIVASSDEQPRMLHLLEGATRLDSVRPSQTPNSFDIFFSH